MFLTKYRPHRGLDSFFDLPTFGRFFDEAEGNDVSVRTPLTNIEDHGTHFLLTMEVPGLDKKDIGVTVENDNIVVSGEKTAENSEEVKGLLRREIRSTKFRRSFQIGDKVDRDNIKAKLENGVLTVTLQKTQEKVGRKVSVD